MSKSNWNILLSIKGTQDKVLMKPELKRLYDLKNKIKFGKFITEYEMREYKYLLKKYNGIKTTNNVILSVVEKARQTEVFI